MKRPNDHEAAAQERADFYFLAQPGSQLAVLLPRITVCADIWVPLSGENIYEGVAGFGPTVEARFR